MHDANRVRHFFMACEVQWENQVPSLLQIAVVGTQPASEHKNGCPACPRAQHHQLQLLPNSEQLRAVSQQRRYSPRQASRFSTATSMSLPALQRGCQRAKGRVSGREKVGGGWGGPGCGSTSSSLREQRHSGRCTKADWEQGSVPRRDEAAPRAVCHQRMTAPRMLWLPVLSQPLIQVSRGRAVLHVLGPAL